MNASMGAQVSPPAPMAAFQVDYQLEFQNPHQLILRQIEKVITLVYTVELIRLSEQPDERFFRLCRVLA